MSRRASPPVALAMLALGMAGCTDAPERDTVAIAGDPERGRREIARLQCGACHEIPGVRAARGSVGPPLDGFARRVYVAGKWPNQPRHLLAWLHDPPAMAPLTAMPALVNDEQSARDIAAYLYTLE
jgi:cytochrome c2